jgi:hypothetical protein
MFFWKQFLLAISLVLGLSVSAYANPRIAHSGTYAKADGTQITLTNEGYAFEGGDGACNVTKSKTTFDQSTHVFSLTFRCAVLAPDEPGSQRVSIAEEKWHFTRIDGHELLVVVWDRGKSSELSLKPALATPVPME